MRANMGTDSTLKTEAVASDWLMRRDAGPWTDVDQARLDAWLNASTLNRVAFLRLELAWEDAARLKALGAGITGDRPPPPGRWNLTPFFDPHPIGAEYEDPPILSEINSASAAFEESPDTWPDAIPTPEEARSQRETGSSQVGEVRDSDAADDTHLPHRSTPLAPPEGAMPFPSPSRSVSPSRLFSSRHKRLFAIAASLLLAVGLVSYLTLKSSGDRYATPVGGFASVPMADGSKVTLNTDSQIRIALSNTERGVELRRGEAFFEVSKDPTRPFIVRAGNKRVIAVGTKFSVRREGDDIEVVVTEGKVRVEDLGKGARPDGSADVFLTPGSVARAGQAGVLVQRKTLPEAEEQLSWRTGVLLFRNQTLADAIAEFNRYNVRKIVIQDPTIAALKIEGNFRATNVEAFVRLLESGFPVRADTQGDHIVLMAK